MLDTYTVTFTGHRYIDNILQVEMRLEQIIRELLQEYEYVEFLVGRDGEFDQSASSTVIRIKGVLEIIIVLLCGQCPIQALNMKTIPNLSITTMMK